MFIPTTQSISTKGQLVIPKKIREILSLEPGAKVTLAVDLPGKILKIQPLAPNPVRAAVGSLKRKGKSSGSLKRLLKQKYAEIDHEE